MKIYTMERGLYKQIKLAKILEFKFKTVRKKRNFRATTNFFNFFSSKKKRKKRKEKLQ